MSYADFVEDYNNWSLTAHDVRRINNLNSKEYSRIRKLAIKNGDIPPVRHMNQTNAKFYSKTIDGNWTVQKQFKDYYKYIGKFPNRESAEFIVNKCLNTNWELTEEIKNDIEKLKCKPKNYSIVNGYYVIQKSVNGKNKVFCRIKQSVTDEDTIRAVVDRLRDVDWIEDYVPSILIEFSLNK